MDESIDAKMSFKDAHLDLTEEQVKIETGAASDAAHRMSTTTSASAAASARLSANLALSISCATIRNARRCALPRTRSADF